MTNNYNKIFFRFLKEKGRAVYISYLRNLEIGVKQNWNCGDKITKGGLLNLTPSNFYQAIDYSFEWSNTNEGNDFWLCVDTELSNLDWALRGE